MSLPSLGHLQPATVTARPVWDEYRALIEDAIANDPRTLQTRIGPSEIGTGCDACLVSKLAGVPERREAAWLPTVGKAVHSWLEEGVFLDTHSWTIDRSRFLVETTVSVGEVGGVDITGHADLFDLHTGTVTDWKITGANTLKKAKPCQADPARFATAFRTYHVQKHLYGYGFTRRGLQVTTVQVAFLPRNAPSLREAVIISAPYDEQVALTAIARADQWATWLHTLGLQATLAVAGAHTGDEYSCARFDPSAATPGRRPTGDQLSGLLAPTTPDASQGAGSTAA